MRMMAAMVALAALLSACGYPNPDAYPRTDAFVGLQSRAFGVPQAPQQNVYCYRTLSVVTDCANQPIPSQEYRLVNAYVAAPPAPGQVSPATSGLPLSVVTPGPISPEVAPPPPPRQTQAAPQARVTPSAAPLMLRPQGPEAVTPAPAAPPPAAALPTPPAGQPTTN